MVDGAQEGLDDAAVSRDRDELCRVGREDLRSDDVSDTAAGQLDKAAHLVQDLLRSERMLLI